MLESYNFRRAAKTTVPVFFGYIAIGIPFGLMLVNAGYPLWLAPLMSIIMFAGAGEYIAIGLFAAGARLETILIAEFLINIRHIVYGLSLITKFKGTGKWKPFLIFGLTDETYALETSCTVPENADRGSYYGVITLLDYIYWITGSTIGAIAGSLIPFSFAGVDFALTALFAVMLINQIKASHDVIPPLIGCLTTVTAVILSRLGYLPGEHILIVALALGIAAIIIVRGGKFHKDVKEGKIGSPEPIAADDSQSEGGEK